MLGRLSRFVIAHKVWIALFWLVVTVIGMATASTTTNRLSTQFATPGREGSDTAQQIVDTYRNGGFDPPVAYVLQLPKSTSVDSVKSQLADLDSKILSSTKGPGGQSTVRIASYASTGDPMFLSADRQTTYGLAFVPRSDGFNVSKEEESIRGLVNNATIAGQPLRLTGYAELTTSTSGNNNGPSLLVEALIGGVGALLVLAFVFASFLALVPLVVAVVSIMATFLLILFVTAFADVSFIVEFLVALIGLGIAVDYSLLIVTRWREERSNGLDNESAIHKAMETAGSAVVFSGTTVGIGLLTLIVLPVPFLRSVGYAGMLIPLVSVLVATTLLPVVLASIGAPDVRWPWRYPLMGTHVRWMPTGVLLFLPRLWRRIATWPNVRREAHASPGWVSWGRLIVRRRWLAAGVALVILGALAFQATRLTVGVPQLDTLSTGGPAKEGLAMLESANIPSSAIGPYEILTPVSSGAPVAQATRKVSGMYGAVAPTSSDWVRNGSTVVLAVSSLPTDTPASRSQVDAVRSAVRQVDPSTRVAGVNAISADFVSAIYGNFPLMLAIVLIATFILLARAFRSLLLPLKAVILNLISVAAAYGIMTLVWQDGHGSSQIFGIQATGAVDEWIPLFVFAFLFGLSMDYEVFILARMREEYNATGNTDLAIVRAVGRTGRLVTCAALILFLAFLVLASGPEVTVKIFATGLAAGILFDATVVRALFVPAAVSILGRWNWWLPRLPARLILTDPSEPKHEQRREVLTTEA
jgi:RND superfamily putative drug exporter